MDGLESGYKIQDQGVVYKVNGLILSGPPSHALPFSAM